MRGATVRVLAVDPGSRTTGVVVRQGAELLAATVVVRERDEELAAYAARLRGRVAELTEEHHVQVHAIEGLTAPNAHLGRGTKVLQNAMDTAQVLGGVVATGHRWRIVPPRGNGSCPKGTPPAVWAAGYPDALWDSREDPRNGGRATGVRRHCRSAWDVAAKAV
jgi:hypothetical protein